MRTPRSVDVAGWRRLRPAPLVLAAGVVMAVGTTLPFLTVHADQGSASLAGVTSFGSATLLGLGIMVVAVGLVLWVARTRTTVRILGGVAVVLGGIAAVTFVAQLGRISPDVIVITDSGHVALSWGISAEQATSEVGSKLAAGSTGIGVYVVAAGIALLAVGGLWTTFTGAGPATAPPPAAPTPLPPPRAAPSPPPPAAPGPPPPGAS